MRLWLADGRGNQFGFRHFLVETPKNSYQGVEFADGQVAVNANGKIGSYASIEDMKADLVELGRRQLINIKLTGDFKDVLVDVKIKKVEGEE